MPDCDSFDYDLKTYIVECVEATFHSSDGLSVKSNNALSRKAIYPPGRSKTSRSITNPASPIIKLGDYFGNDGIP